MTTDRVETIPNTRTLVCFDPEEGECSMLEFRLTYKGPLKAASAGSGSSNVRQKHSIRRQFNLQMRELWRQHPNLRQQSEILYCRLGGNVIRSSAIDPDAKSWPEHIADEHARYGYRFVPLVSKEGGFTCALDILFLRRDNPGSLLAHGGDIDNRIKTLLDSLTMPGSTSQMAGEVPGDNEDPFYCLLEDDSLVTSVSITTDRLLTPMDAAEKMHDVDLVIHVTVTDPSALFTGNRLV